MNNIVHTFLKESPKPTKIEDLNGLDRYYMEREEKYDSFSIKASYDMFYDIRDLIKYCFIESNPVPVKFMISKLANEPNMSIVRLPLVELSNKSKDKSILLL
jgi:dihydrodipicolinate synthase/N-acetylneuraminate lyase